MKIGFLFLSLILAASSVLAGTPVEIMMQPDKSIPGTEITYTAGYYTPTHAAKASASKTACRVNGFESSSAGVLCVHLVNDYDGAGAKRYALIIVAAGQRVGALFDQIKEVGTTVTLANITLFPE